MTIVDTSVWVAHFRRPDALLVELISRDDLLMHPFVVGELAAGNLPKRATSLADLGDWPAAPMAAPDEVLALVETRRLWGLGLGWVDLHLLASALVSKTTLFTYDKQLAGAAKKLGIAFNVQ